MLEDKSGHAGIYFLRRIQQRVEMEQSMTRSESGPIRCQSG